MSSTIWHSRGDDRTEGEVKTENKHKRYKKSAVSEEVQLLNCLSWKTNLKKNNDEKSFLPPIQNLLMCFIKNRI